MESLILLKSILLLSSFLSSLNLFNCSYADSTPFFNLCCVDNLEIGKLFKILFLI